MIWSFELHVGVALRGKILSTGISKSKQARMGRSLLFELMWAQAAMMLMEAIAGLPLPVVHDS